MNERKKTEGQEDEHNEKKKERRKKKRARNLKRKGAGLCTHLCP